MKVSKKSGLIILIAIGIILIIVGVVSSFGQDNKNKNSSAPDNEERPEQQSPVDENEIFSSTEEKEKNDVLISNFKYSKSDNVYVIKLDVTNNTKKNYDNLIVRVAFYGEEHVFLSSADFHLGKFASGESKTVEREVYFELSNIVDYSFFVIS